MRALKPLRIALDLAGLVLAAIALFGESAERLHAMRATVERLRPPDPIVYLKRYWSGVVHTCPAGRFEPAPHDSVIGSRTIGPGGLLGRFDSVAIPQVVHVPGDTYCAPASQSGGMLMGVVRVATAAAHAATGGELDPRLRSWLGVAYVVVGAAIALLLLQDADSVHIVNATLAFAAGLALSGVVSWLIAIVALLIARAVDATAALAFLMLGPVAAVDRVLSRVEKLSGGAERIGELAAKTPTKPAH